MTEILVAVVAVIAFVVVLWLGEKALDGDKVSIAAVTVAALILVSLIIGSHIAKAAIGPCHEYKTQMMYNTATKTMMPSRVCVLRGEWVE